MPIEHINKTDTLNEGREKLNEAIDGANAADVTSKAADTKATQALANSESTQTQLDTIVIDGDSSVEAAQARVDEKGVPHPTLKDRIDDGLNSVNQQLAETAKDIRSRGVNIKYPPIPMIGAKGGGIVDDTEAIRNISSILGENDTLIIPNDSFLITDKIEINCNVICHGEFLIPNNAEASEFIEFPYGEMYTKNGAEIFNSLKKGDLKLDIKPSEVDQNLANYYFRITSSEKIMNRLGNSNYSPYYKLESGEIKLSTDNKVVAKTPIVFDYDDVANLDITFYKKLKTIEVVGLTVKRVDKGTNNYNQTMVAVRRNSVYFKGLTIDNEAKTSLNRGVNITQTHNLLFDDLIIRNVFGDGDTYPVINSNSSFITFNRYRYEHDGEYNSRGYAARHGNYITFNDCEIYGIDDHFGYNYEVNDTKIIYRGISFAGHNLKLSNTDFFDCGRAISIRRDTPHCTGVLDLENVDFYNCDRQIYYGINSDPLGRNFEIQLKFFDKIVIEKCRTINSYENSTYPTVKNNTRYANKNFIYFLRGEVYDEFVECGEIIFKDNNFDVANIRLHPNIPMKIKKIEVKNHNAPLIEGVDDIESGNIRGFGYHEIDEIILTNCDSTVYFSIVGGESPSVNRIKHINCEIKDYDGLIKYRSRDVGNTLTTFQDCELNASPLNLEGNIILKNNVLKRNSIFSSGYAKVIMSMGNVAYVELSDNELPPLNDFIDPEYFKTTGIIVDSDMNPSVGYIRWDNGMQICWRNTVIDLSNTSEQLAEYPVSFLENPVGSWSSSTTSSSVTNVLADAVLATSTTNWRFKLSSDNVSSGQTTVRLLAVGKWK